MAACKSTAHCSMWYCTTSFPPCKPGAQIRRRRQITSSLNVVPIVATFFVATSTPSKVAVLQTLRVDEERSHPSQTLAVTFRWKTILLPARLPALWLLSLLQLLRLLLVSCLQLLRLLLMALFHLLPLRVIRLLFIQLHVLLVLLLLELVSFLLLLRGLLFLLLLVLPVPLRVARIWSAPCHGRKVARMNGCAGLSSAIL